MGINLEAAPPLFLTTMALLSLFFPSSLLVFFRLGKWAVYLLAELGTALS